MCEAWRANPMEGRGAGTSRYRTRWTVAEGSEVSPSDPIQHGPGRSGGTGGLPAILMVVTCRDQSRGTMVPRRRSSASVPRKKRAPPWGVWRIVARTCTEVARPRSLPATSSRALTWQPCRLRAPNPAHTWRGITTQREALPTGD